MSGGWRRGLIPVLVLIILSAAGLAGMRFATLSLRQVWFISGWVLLATLLLLGAFVLWKLRSTPPRVSGPSSVAFLNLVTFLLYALHTDLRVPRGRFEIVLALLFLLMVSSGIFGTLAHAARAHLELNARSSPWEPLLLRCQLLWPYVYVPLLWSLIPLCVLHGVLSHAHGFLAHTFGIAP